ncbi:SPOR domain-containing protein [Allochromatium palmeri]|uniref:SPOR domain-containing protein n=1 Tax=Allochromatium palmeri TaxID=231048 RepID=A0A6N8EAL3_9GAMM|nr:SPOR domain-containing protein [Allochromatium palmeri]MTW20500.1 SPOR domain-containing protein [Allochromatium palmeri]
MPKDYYRDKPPPPSPPSTPPIRRKPNRSCIGWMIGGVALGVIGSQILAPRSGPSEESVGAAQASQPVLKPTFTYEKILSETEVDVSKLPPPPPSAPRPQPQLQALDQAPQSAPEPVSAQTPEPEPSISAALPPSTDEPRSGTYVVQVASFSRTADAERFRSQLAQLGLSTNVQTATLPNGRTAYRVRTGAYSSRQDAEQVRALLKRQGQDGMVIPIK